MTGRSASALSACSGPRIKSEPANGRSLSRAKPECLDCGGRNRSGKRGLSSCSTGKDDRAMSRFDVLHMIKRRVEAAGLPYPRCHTFRAPQLRLICRTAARLEHAQTSPITNRPERLSYTISPARNSRSSKSRASTSKPVPNFASGLRGWSNSQRALLRPQHYTRRPPSRTTHADGFARCRAKPYHNRIEQRIPST